MATIRFCFDYISPYAYLAWSQLHALAERTRATVEPEPILFAALLNAHGTKGPAEIPAKRLYVIQDVVRSAKMLGIPLAPPPSHPFNPLTALRLTSLPMDAEVRRKLIDALFAAARGGGPGITEDGILASIAERAGFDGSVAVREAHEAPAKERVRAQTERALQSGAFGVPTMFVGGELFWGYDSLGHLERYLNGAEPADPALLQRWKDLPASANRKI